MRLLGWLPSIAAVEAIASPSVISKSVGVSEGKPGTAMAPVCSRPDSGENTVPLAIQLQDERLSDAGSTRR